MFITYVSMRITTKMKPVLAGISVILGFAITLSGADDTNKSAKAKGDELIAIDIVIQPDRTMIDQANALNARLRENYPGGYKLDATHAPHVSLLQRFVRLNDLDAVKAAVEKVLATERPTELTLKATGIDYAVWQGLAVTVLLVERTPELMQLDQKVIDAVEPFSVSGGTAKAFAGGDANPQTIAWVENFIPQSSGMNYIAHVTSGVAPPAFVNGLKAEPFKDFTFKPVGIAIYHLGNFGTAAKKLWQKP
jgi:hypothetical protein